MTKFIFTEPLPSTPGTWTLHQGDALEVLRTLPDGFAKCVITSPPYFRKFSYGCGSGEHGLERRLIDYINYQAFVARELRRVCTHDANLFLVIQDSFNGSGGKGGDFADSIREASNPSAKDHSGCYGAREKQLPLKSQLLIPERLRLAYADMGWIPRLTIVWDKKDSRRGAKDTPSYSYEEVLIFGGSEEASTGITVGWPDDERILVFSVTQTNFWNREVVLTPFHGSTLPRVERGFNYAHQDPNGRNQAFMTPGLEAMLQREGAYLRAVWDINPGPQPIVEVDGEWVKGIACFPLLLAEIMVNLGSAPGDAILDPFAGLATTGLAACKWNRNFVGIELGERWHRAAVRRLIDQGYSRQENGNGL